MVRYSPGSVRTTVQSSLLLATATVFLLNAVHGANAPLPIDDEDVRSSQLLLPHFKTLDETIVDDISNDIDPIIYRLPNNTRPIAYNIHLTTNVHTQNDFNFTGTVAITLEGVGNPSNTITLHHRELTILSAKLSLSTTPNVDITLIQPPAYNAENEFLTYTLGTGATPIQAGLKYVLTIKYTGTLRTDESGFYRSSYVSAAGEKRWLATTQFEQTDARHAFPCYDEPALRAHFTLRITHGKDYHAISNMPVDGKPLIDGGLTTTKFQELRSSPPYLVAFVVSDFASISAATDSGFVQRVFARPTAIADGPFGLQTGIKSLSAFENYFNIKFSLPKMDQIAIPDFFWGAMENWGLVTYRESALLYSEARSTFNDLRRVATVIAHEYAHQYFGNLVTPKWWSYIWLNEGFANLFENVATNWLFPEWKIMDAYALSAQSVMVPDSTNRTRPMTFYVEKRRPITNLFDNIAYAKSGAVLHMFMHAFTESTFKKALTSYLNQKQFSDAQDTDLFAAIEKAAKADGTLLANLDTAKIMASWTNHAGYPVLSVSRSKVNNTVTLTQRRYFSEKQQASAPDNVWWIPYNWATASEAHFNVTTPTAWLGDSSATINVNTLKTGDWLLLNKRQTGYYRVQYDAHNYELLAAALQKNVNSVHLVSRSQLLNDAFELARSGHQTYAAALELSKFLADDVEYVPWAAAWNGFSDIERLLYNSTSYPKFSKYALKLVKKLYTASGFQAASNEHHYRKQSRIQAIHWACDHGHADCLTKTFEQFSNFLANGTAIHQDHRGAVLCQGARNATNAQRLKLINLLQNENDQDERNRYIDALTCVNTAAHMLEFLQTSTGSEHRWTSQTERYRVFTQVARKRLGWQVATEFLRTNLRDAAGFYGRGNVNDAFGRIAAQVNSAERKAKFNELIASVDGVSIVDASTIRSAQLKIEANDQWLNTNRKLIEEFMEKNGASTLMMSSAVMTVLMVLIGQMFSMRL